MGDIKFSCPTCGRHLVGDAALRGTSVQCPDCTTMFEVVENMVPPPLSAPKIAPAITPPSRQEFLNQVRARSCYPKIRLTIKFQLASAIIMAALLGLLIFLVSLIYPLSAIFLWPLIVLVAVIIIWRASRQKEIMSLQVDTADLLIEIAMQKNSPIK